MPIMALFRSPRVDQRMYDAIMQELDVETRPAAGGLAHACGFDGNSICVADVWESRQAFDAFLSERLKPAFARLGFEFVAPEIIDLYTLNVSEDADRYVPARAAGLQPSGQAGGPGPQPSGAAH